MLINDQPHRFVQVPVELLESDDLSPSALKLYCILLSYCWGKKTKAWPGHAKLAEQMHCTDRWIRQLLKELTAAGLVRVEERLGTTCVYHIHKFQLVGAAPAESTELSIVPVDNSAPVQDSSGPLRKNSSDEEHESESKSNTGIKPKIAPSKRLFPGYRPKPKNPIDWSKFAPGGKYHYLCQSVT